MEITSRRNERARHMRRLGESASYREWSGEYLCEGAKLLDEALKWHAPIKQVFTTVDLPTEIPNAQVYRVTAEVLEAVSALTNPQKVLFTVKLPERSMPDTLSGAIVLENIQDPGNVGTVLRTANAFKASTVILTGMCAELYSPKVVRAAMGAHFRQRFYTLSYEELGQLIQSSPGTPLYGAALQPDARDVRDVDMTACAVAIGNEGSGLTPRLLGMCAGTVIIPMSPECESLNAAQAAGIFLWERYRNINANRA